MPQTVYQRFGQTANPAPRQIVRRRMVRGAETIPMIAAEEFNAGYDSLLWRRIAEYNEIDDLNDVTAGTVIKVPPPDVSET